MSNTFMKKNISWQYFDNLLYFFSGKVIKVVGNIPRKILLSFDNIKKNGCKK